MGEVEQWEILWHELFDKLKGDLQRTHRFEQKSAPFDIWAFWTRGISSQRRQGWKIHLSPHPEILPAVLNDLAALSTHLIFDFKVIGSYRQFVRLNAGHLGESQVGKTITIYPETQAASLELYKHFGPLSRDFQGPQCPSDFYFSEKDRVSFRWGQWGEAHTVYDSLGKPKHFLDNDIGEWVEDVRTMPATLPRGVAPLSFEGLTLKALPIEVPSSIEWEGKKLVVKHNYGRILKQVLLVEDLQTQRLFIAKRLWKGLGLTTGGRTYREEAFNENSVSQYLVQQAFYYQAKVIAQRETPWFFESLMEDAGGDSLEKLPAQWTRQYWPQILEAVGALHQQGLVHRDLKRRNLIMNETSVHKITLIDFELAGFVGEKLPCSSGTHSFKAPESEKGAPFTLSMDNYALGSLVFEMALGRDPSMYLIPEENRVALLQLNGYQQAAKTVSNLYLPASERMTLEELKTISIQQLLEKSDPVFEKVTAKEVKSALTSTVESLPYFQEWINPEVLLWSNQHLLSTVKHRGINIGSSGILIGLLELYSVLPGQQELLDRWITATARGLVEGKPFDKAQGFMTGNAGTAYALMLAALKMQRSDWLDHSVKLWNFGSENFGEPDFFSGMAGRLFVALHLIKQGDCHQILPSAEKLVTRLLEDVVDYEGLWAWPPSNEFGGHPTLGASHGAAGIAMVLSQWAEYIGDSELMEFAAEVFRRLYQQGLSSQGQALRYDVHPNSQPRAATDWCHGAGSYLWAVLNSSCLDVDLLEEKQWATDLFLNTPIASNSTYCHGLAGQLELSMMLKHSERIERLQRALLLQTRRLSDHSTWPSENPEQFTPDLWVGFLGPAVSLARSFQGNTHALFSVTREQ